MRLFNVCIMLSAVHGAFYIVFRYAKLGSLALR